MRPVILASVFLVVNCVCGALSVELIREQQSQDLLKLTRKKSQISKRRFRRDVNEEDPDMFNADTAQGKCKVPTLSDDRKLNKFDWKFENETKLSISMSWIGKRNTGESSAMLLLATTEFMFLFSKPSELYKR
ncbi:hypothetical protein OS493_039978 [Desmophyllum pertusum]|uniref:Uncharacterized protein n=1 Tax=Desmophyllum pertusum TaxID=174260 RepID=A0A9W9YIJ2_9CNID|nr:hypothetical protein OS493_039978 [Desmophyllum pertusum]